MIPQTLLWVGLVVAWLVVLVPMLVARHPKVNTVTDATLKTRLLHRGGSAKTAVRRKIRPSATVADDGPRDATPDDAEEERLLPAAEELDLEADDLDEAHAYVDSDVDGPDCLPVPTPDVFGPLDGDTVEIVAVERAEVAAPAPAPVAKVVEVEELPEAPEPEDLADALPAEVEAEDLVDALPAEDLADQEIPADEALTEEVAPVVRSQVERSEDDDEEFADGARRRRGGFDPENDARLTEARYRFRQRVTLALGVLAVIALGAGLMNVQYAWYALGALAVALLLYLTYLRRTVRIESEIRHRRMARLERARREREREAEVVDGVPAHLRRGGCVVMEIDDEDPAFDHLPRYRAEEFDFLRRQSDLRESLQRKVG